MLFISSSASLMLPLKSKQAITATEGRSAKIIGWEPKLGAQFTYGGGIPPWAVALAEETFGESLRRGLPDGVNPHTRIGWFDTRTVQAEQSWSDETREYVEQRLLKHPVYGIDFILAEQPPLRAPWPNYSKVSSVEKIMEKVIEDGYDPAEVSAYERENKNRENVLAALLTYAQEREESEVVA